MNNRNMIKRKALIILFIIVLSLVFIYLAISLLFFEADPLIGFLGRVTNAYLLFQEGIDWLTPTSVYKKLMFSGFFILLNFIMSPVTISIQACLSAGGTDLYSNTRISRTAAHLINLTMLFVWLRIHRQILWKFLSRTRIDPIIRVD